MAENKENSFNETLNLPVTEFPMRGGLPQKEPLMLEKMKEDDLYGKIREKRDGAPKYILHDGPPYANGNIHLGHALNKILKDIILKYKTLQGFDAPYTPGWDTHGLPIEQRAIKDFGLKRHEIDTLVFRDKCKEFALGFVDTQREQFKRLGVLADWDNPYVTLMPKFEEEQIRVFGTMAEKGYIYKGKKPVYWCPHCETSLAEAEIEYAEDKATSIYIKFPLHDGKGKLAGNDVYCVIWTTTPWTIPANMAICIHPELTYVTIKVNDERWLVGEDLIPGFTKACKIESYEILERFKGRDLEGLTFKHPLYDLHSCYDRDSVVILGEHVTTEAGTGCVHTAPGHGVDDFNVGMKYGLEVLCPVDNKGKMTKDAGPFEGLFVDDCSVEVIKALAANGRLVGKESIRHQYPHCWRCKNPIIFRAAEQWFVSIDGFRKAALDAIDNEVKWIPGWGHDRIYNMIADRGDWCISRQRTWGVPIPIFYCKDCGEPIINKETIDRIATIFGEKGSNAWWEMTEEQLLPEGYKCPKCGGTHFKKESDIMDVWFDSGSSHYSVLRNWPKLTWPADLYLEGSDQHRGWFNSSLCTSVAMTGHAPYKACLTHGFLVDEQGRKQSKSLGNVVDPLKVCDQMGADILRLWVSSADYRNDLASSDSIMKQVSDTYRKIRNTVRYLLGNLSDFDATKDMVSYENMVEIDKFALDKLANLIEKYTEAFDNYEFHVAYHALHKFCTVDMSAFYLDIIKVRLYCDTKDGLERRSAQSAMWEILNAITILMAPVLSFTAEEIWQYLPSSKNQPYAMLSDWPKAKDEWKNPDLAAKWDKLISFRDEALKPLEQARSEKLIGQSLEARIIIHANKDEYSWLSEYEGYIPELLIVSQAELYLDDTKALTFEVVKASGTKCPRCWCYHEDNDPDGLCPRCQKVVK